MRFPFFAALLFVALLLGGVAWTASSQEALQVQVDGAAGSLGLDDEVAGDLTGYQELNYSEAPTFSVAVESLEAIVATLILDVHLTYESEAAPSYTFHFEAPLAQGFTTHTVTGDALEWSGLYHARMDWRVEQLGVVLAQGSDGLGSVLQRVHLRDFQVQELNATQAYTGGTYDSDTNTYIFQGGEYDILYHEYRVNNAAIHLGHYDAEQNTYIINGGTYDEANDTYLLGIVAQGDGVVQQGQRVHAVLDLYNPPKIPRPFALDLKNWDEGATVHSIQVNTSQEVTLIPVETTGLRNGLYNVEVQPQEWTTWNPDTPSTPLAVGVQAARAKVAVTTTAGVEASLEVWTGTSSSSSTPITSLDRRSDTTSFYMWASWSETGVLDPDHAEITYTWYNDNKFHEFYSGSATLAAKDTNYYLGVHSTSSRSYMPGSWMLWVSVDFQNSLDVSLATGDSDGAGDTDEANSHVGVVRIAPRVTAARFYQSDYTTIDAGFMVGEPTYLEIDLTQGMTSSSYLISDASSSTGKLQEYTAEVTIGSTTHFALDFVPYSTTADRVARVESGSGFVSHSAASGYKYRMQIDSSITAYHDGQFSVRITTNQYSYFSGMKWAGILTTGGTEWTGNSFDTIDYSDQLTLTATAGKPYLNRGQTTTITGQVHDAWGEPFAAMELNMDITHGQGEHDVATITTQGDGGFSTTWTAPTTALDTYDATAPGVEEPLNYALEVHYPSTTTNPTTGSHGSTTPNGGSFSDDFNNGVIDDAKWTTIGAVVNNDCGSNSAPSALKFDGATRSATTVPLHVSSGGQVKFYLRIGTGSSPCENADSSESVQLQYSTNGGSTWTTLATYGPDSYPSFTLISQSIPVAAESTSTQFRWTQPAFSGTCCDHWAIDDVEITSSTSQQPSNVLDVDASYYIDTSSVHDATVNRGDSIQADLRLVDASNTGIPEDHRATLYLACTTEQESSDSTGIDGQRSAIFTIPNDAAPETCSIDAQVVADPAGTDGNSMPRSPTGASVSVGTSITIQSLTLAPSGGGAASYYNRGEGVQVSGVLQDGWAEAPYRMEHPGGDAAREIRVHLYLDTIQGTGFVTSGPSTVDPATGAFTVTVILPTIAQDTYASTKPGQLEAVEWDVEVLDAAAAPGGATHNHGSALDRFDVDGNYYTRIEGSTSTTLYSSTNVVERRSDLDVPSGQRALPFYHHDLEKVVVVYSSSLAYYWTGDAWIQDNSLGASFTQTAGSLAITSGAVIDGVQVLYSSGSSGYNGRPWNPGTESWGEPDARYAPLEATSSYRKPVVFDWQGSTYMVLGRGSTGGVPHGFKWDSTSQSFQGNTDITNGIDSLSGYPSPAFWTDNGTAYLAFTKYNVGPSRVYERSSTDTAWTEITDPGLDAARLANWAHAAIDLEGLHVLFRADSNTDADAVALPTTTTTEGPATMETTILARGDTYRIQAVARNVRDEPVPGGVTLEFTWRDAAQQVQYVESLEAFDGLTTQDQFFDNNDRAGAWSIQVEIHGTSAGNNGNSAGPLQIQEVVDLRSEIGILGLDVSVAGTATTYVQRGETVRVEGTLLHPDGGAYRVKSTWAPAPRSIQVHLHKDTPGHPGSTTSTFVEVDPATGAFTADILLSSTAPDTYTSTVPGQVEPVEWDLLLMDSGTFLDADGNRATSLNAFDVDGGVYVEQWFEGDADADVDDIDFNSGLGRNRGPDTDHARLYVQNVRGEGTTQFTNLQVQRTQHDPFTGAVISTQSASLLPDAVGYYKGDFGAFPAWTTSSIQYELLSQDLAGNQALHGEVLRGGGKVHYLVARSQVSGDHVLRSQDTSVTVDFMDSYEDALDNGSPDFSANPMPGLFTVDLRDYHDDADTYDNQIQGVVPSGSTFSLAFADSDVVDWRDLNIDVTQGELSGHEWHEANGVFDQHSRSGLGDDEGAFLVDDLVPTMVLLDQDSYLPSDVVQATTLYAYAHGSITTTPANEAYPHLVTRFLRPDGAPMDVSLFADANQFQHAGTDAEGRTTAFIALSANAQAWADYQVQSTTLSGSKSTGYDVAIQFGTPAWFAHPGSNPANDYAPATLHNRGETVSLHVPVLNNILGFQPSTATVHDDDAGELLDSQATWVPETSTAVMEWTWKTIDDASPTGAPHSVLATLTLGGSTSQASSPPALLHDALVADVHLQRSDALQRDGIHDENEDTEFFIALDVVNLWFHAQNIRGEDWANLPLHATIAAPGSTNHKATYDEATLLDAWTQRVEYAPVPPTGTLAVTLTSPATGNTAPTVQEFMILSPNTDEYILDPQGWNHYVELGRPLDIDVRVLRWDRDTRTMQENVPDEPPLLRLEYSDGDGAWTPITQASMTHVAGTTYRYTWNVPTEAAWLEREISASFGASFSGAWKWSPTQIAAIQKGGADPVHVTASPVIANPGEEVRLAIHESFLDATARLGNAAGTTVLILDPSGSTASTGNPLEIGYGAYRYSYTLPVTAATGPWEVIVHTTDSVTGAINAASTTLWVEPDTDAAIRDQLSGLEARLAQDIQVLLQNHAATQGAVMDLDADVAQSVAALLVRHDVTQAELADLDADVAAVLVQLLAKHDLTHATLADLDADVAASLAQLLVEHDLAQAAMADLDADVAASLSQLLVQHGISQAALADLDGDVVQAVAALLVKHNVTQAQLADVDADVAAVLVQLLAKHDLTHATLADLDADVAASLAQLLVEHDLAQAAMADLDADVAASLAQLLVQHGISQAALADLDGDVVQAVAALLVKHNVTQTKLAGLDADVAAVLVQLLAKHDLTHTTLSDLDADVAASLAQLLVEHDLSQAALADLDADVAGALSVLLAQHALTQQQLGDLQAFVQQWRLDQEASLATFESNMSLHFQSSWNRLDANQAESRQAHDALLTEIRVFWAQHDLATSTNHAEVVQSFLDHDAALQQRVDTLLASIGTQHALTRQEVQAFHADYTQRQNDWLLDFAAYRAENDADHAEIIQLLAVIDAKLLQQYAALLDFEASTNQALGQQRADLHAFWADMNATLDAAELDRAARVQEVLLALSDHTASLQSFLSQHHDDVTLHLTSAQAFNEAAFAQHDQALQGVLHTSLAAIQGNFTLLSSLVAQGDEATQAQVQAFWTENTQTWTTWQANHENSRQVDAASMAALIQGQHNQTRQRDAQLSEDYFNKYGLMVSDFSGYVVGGLGEEILTNREAISQDKEAGFMGLLWTNLLADILRFTFYGVLATILLLFVGNSRARRAIKMFAPLSRVIEHRERRRRRRHQRRLQDLLHRAPPDQGRARSADSPRRKSPD